jgi:hypothetical protein
VTAARQARLAEPPRTDGPAMTVSGTTAGRVLQHVHHGGRVLPDDAPEAETLKGELLTDPDSYLTRGAGWNPSHGVLPPDGSRS